jgi:DNA-binding beta-propeller fold protein YncE
VQIGTATSYLSDLALSLDGSTLFALDQSTGITYPVDTNTLTVGTPIPRPNLPPSTTVPIVFSGLLVQP